MNKRKLEKMKETIKNLTKMSDQLETMEDYFLQEKGIVEDKDDESTVFGNYKIDIIHIANLLDAVGTTILLLCKKLTHNNN